MKNDNSQAYCTKCRTFYYVDGEPLLGCECMKPKYECMSCDGQHDHQFASKVAPRCKKCGQKMVRTLTPTRRPKMLENL